MNATIKSLTIALAIITIFSLNAQAQCGGPGGSWSCVGPGYQYYAARAYMYNGGGWYGGGYGYGRVPAIIGAGGNIIGTIGSLIVANRAIRSQERIAAQAIAAQQQQPQIVVAPAPGYGYNAYGQPAPSDAQARIEEQRIRGQQQIEQERIRTNAQVTQQQLQTAERVCQEMKDDPDMREACKLLIPGYKPGSSQPATAAPSPAPTTAPCDRCRTEQ